jgi:hypothetical protein
MAMAFISAPRFMGGQRPGKTHERRPSGFGGGEPLC